MTDIAQKKNSDIFLNTESNINCECSVEPRKKGSSYEHTQFYKKKNNV